MGHTGTAEGTSVRHVARNRTIELESGTPLRTSEVWVEPQYFDCHGTPCARVLTGFGPDGRPTYEEAQLQIPTHLPSIEWREGC